MTKTLHKSSFNKILFLLTLVGLLFIFNISLGSVSIPFSEIFAVLSGQESERYAWQQIVLQFRLPKAITATLVGAGLALSGLQMQTLFRNPLAGPFVLGISSGASLGVALLVMAGVSIGGFLAMDGILGTWMIVFAASIGSALVLLLVVAASLRIKDSMTLLILGLMFGSATGAIVSVLQYFSEAEQIQAYLIWTFGSLGGLNWGDMYIFVPVVLLGSIIVFVMQKPLNALLLGENYAQSMGLNLRMTRIWIIASTSLLAGSITAFCGPIAFIGITVPHFARILFDTADHKVLVPAVALCGAALMLFCDIIAQIPGAEQTLPINAVTSLFGAPVVIWIILSRKNIRNSFVG